MYVNVILSPSASEAPLAAQVSVEETVAFAGVNVAALTEGAEFEIVTVLELPDALLEAVPSFAITVQNNLSPFATFAEVNTSLFVGPYTVDEPALASLKYQLYVYVILSPSTSAAPSGAHVNVELTVAVFGVNVAPRTVGAVFEMTTTFDSEDSTLMSVPSSANAVQ